MRPLHTFSLVLTVLLLWLLSASMYTVQQGQGALVMRLGKIINLPGGDKAKVEKPGLHFKLPLLDVVRKFDMRLQTKDITHLTIVTSLKKDVIVDYYAKWRIDDLALFYKRTTGNVLTAENLLQQRLTSGLRAQFGKRTIEEVVSEDRVDIMAILKEEANKDAHDLGISVVDVRIKRIDLPEAVSEKVFDRMRAERMRIVQEHLAEGNSMAEGIRADADAKAVVIRAEAQKKAETMRATGDAKAAKIYADAYGRDAKFYAFYRSLLAYRKTFHNKRDLIVLRPDSQFFDFFNGSKSSVKH